MIYGYLHQGSGLGNQLARYVATRVKALDLGVDWGMIYTEDNSGKPEGFKGKDFIKGFEENTKLWHIGFTKGWNAKIFNEKKVVENGVDIRSYDPEFNFIEDNTVIEGEFQDERYWEHREKEVDEWLKVEPLDMPDDLCVIGFRGGEFSIYPDLFLTPEYYQEAIEKMLKINPKMRFEVHTDDKPLATEFFGGAFPVIHDIGINWRSMRFAKYAIIPNSSFFILPRWLRHGEKLCNICNNEENSHLGHQHWCVKNYHSEKPTKFTGDALTIAPRYWGRHNIKVWSLNQNYYKRFTYL